MKALIIEDEGLAARNLVRILAEIGGIEPIATLESIADTIEWFHHNEVPDLIFMDIHLADGSSFEIFKLVKINCPVIFTTAYDEYALQAFKVNSIDYLLKPVEMMDVKRALDKLKGFANRNNDAYDVQKLLSLLKPGPEYKTHFLVMLKGNKLTPLKTDDIACFYIDATVVKAKTFAGKSFVMDFTLDEIVPTLNPKDFFKANRQYIISRNAIKDIDLWFNARLSVNLTIPVEEQILISKARIPDFKKWFE